MGDGRKHDTIFSRLGTSQVTSLFFAALLLFVFLSIFAPAFLTMTNIQNMVRQSSVLAILAAGQLLPVLTGGVDFSVDAILAISGVVAAEVTLVSNPWFGWVLGGAIGAGIGAVNGLLIARLRFPAFIATLGMLTVLRGGVNIAVGGMPVQLLPASFNALAATNIGILPLPLILVAVVFTTVALVLKYTQFGKHIYAVGGSRRSASAAGVNVARTEFLVYTCSGLLAGIAGVLLASRMSSGHPGIGEAAGLEAVGAVFLGGVSFYGGVGSVKGVVMGVALLALLSTGLNLLGISSSVQRIFVGAVLILAVGMQRFVGEKEVERERT